MGVEDALEKEKKEGDIVMRQMLHHGGEQKIETCLTNHISQALDDVAHLVGAVGSKLKTELDNKDGGLRDEVDVGQDLLLQQVALCRQQGGGPQSCQHLAQTVIEEEVLIWNNRSN